MKRFIETYVKKEIKLLLSVALFLIIFYAFTSGISKLSHSSDTKQTELLHLAISRGITHCYATNGHYPESLDYLKENYGITYDEDKYFVDYQVFGKNIFPDITIIEK